ncbi:MAG: type II toxin-antitoxin system RelE/ParE family toxin [Gammaproteobacteria bacterium]|nr:type II toxin-antitoxin system RelE/ParE family toxin [Gammaproteobacteria bacterium]MBU1555490.1 type II toxin-antitoxin system RelE/ParE family toxin [Gammaproteobacteria bacterium]MBU2072411.1 type II toxin-antitoxin system RelE/ParE family toxin [Gammaproteobacteria bacterium]MBU2183335.1 type II toxin-antitoxin system RelE/ParE family toxin [Gammaproteobacteria bacterium]MBU2203122.1 type II toxin-antitoxin system RelE/ParE family toxin [Gammaproteobacteria bacterium]
MRVFKNKAFAKWAHKEGLSDRTLLVAVAEMEQGLIDADLGSGVYKKRVATAKGKSSGGRTLIAYRFADKAFFVYGFAKNAKANITATELKALRILANDLLNYSDTEIYRLLDAGALFEINADD